MRCVQVGVGVVCMRAYVDDCVSVFVGESATERRKEEVRFSECVGVYVCIYKQNRILKLIILYMNLLLYN